MIAGRNAMLANRKKQYWGLCFTAEEDNVNIGLFSYNITTYIAPNVNLKISTDGKNWIAYTRGTVIKLPKAGDYVYFAAGEEGNTNFAVYYYGYNYFSTSGKVAASGSINSLLNADEETETLPAAYCFTCLFKGSKLTTAPELPATTLASYCYYGLFQDCKFLTESPVLPATTLADHCY